MTAHVRKRVPNHKPPPVSVVGVNRSNGMFSITARHRIEQLPGNELEELASQQLISHVRLGSDQAKAVQGTPAARPRDALSADRVLGLSVKRITKDGRELPGRVTALRGVVELIDVDRQRRACTGLIEVEFDQFLPPPLEGKAAHGRAPTPTLQSDDAGALVISWDGSAIGIIVGGSKRRAFVAPLKPFIDYHKLTIGIKRNTNRVAQERDRGNELLQRGTQTYLEELARETPLQLHEWPENVA